MFTVSTTNGSSYSWKLNNQIYLLKVQNLISLNNFAYGSEYLKISVISLDTSPVYYKIRIVGVSISYKHKLCFGKSTPKLQINPYNKVCPIRKQPNFYMDLLSSENLSAKTAVRLIFLELSSKQFGWHRTALFDV